jgi:hypothetical protein
MSWTNTKPDVVLVSIGDVQTGKIQHIHDDRCKKAITNSIVTNVSRIAEPDQGRRFYLSCQRQLPQSQSKSTIRKVRQECARIKDSKIVIGPLLLELNRRVTYHIISEQLK